MRCIVRCKYSPGRSPRINAELIVSGLIHLLIKRPRGLVATGGRIASQQTPCIPMTALRVMNKARGYLLKSIPRAHNTALIRHGVGPPSWSWRSKRSCAKTALERSKQLANAPAKRARRRSRSAAVVVSILRGRKVTIPCTKIQEAVGYLTPC